MRLIDSRASIRASRIPRPIWMKFGAGEIFAVFFFLVSASSLEIGALNGVPYFRA